MKLLLTGIVLAGFIRASLAHYKIQSLIVNETRTAPYYYIRKNTNGFNFLANISSPDIRCNEGTLESGPTTEIATVVAGSEVGMAADQPMFHPGPATVYLSKAEGDLHTYDGGGPWFKIAEISLNRSEIDIWSYYLWYNLNQRDFNFTVPATTPPGDYLMRFEQIGLHDSMYMNGAQFYISCAQVRIVGQGGGQPAPLVSIPGAYNQTDPGLYLPDSVNFPFALPTPTNGEPLPVITPPSPKDYRVPGPPVWQG